MGVPPEIRRRIPGGVRAAAGATEVADHERLALQKAKQKLLESRKKLCSTVAALRSQLASGQ